MTLLQRLQSALNKLYDGNTVSLDESKQDGESYKDAYKCDCGSIVSIEEWNEESKMCCDCYMQSMEEAKLKYGGR